MKLNWLDKVLREKTEHEQTYLALLLAQVALAGVAGTILLYILLVLLFALHS